MNIFFSILFGIAGLVALVGLCLFQCELNSEVKDLGPLTADESKDAWAVRSYFVVFIIGCVWIADHFLSVG
jgi:hypothetical protein